MDTGLSAVPLPLPGGHFTGQFGLAVQPPVQALAIHDADLRLGHVQPAAVLGRVMPLDLVQQPPGVLRLECLVQTRPVMGIEVVLHQPDLPGPWVMHFHQLPNAPGIVLAGPSVAHLDVTPAPQRLAHHQLIADALAFVLVILLGRAARPAQQRLSDLAEQLLAGLVEADHRVARVVRQKVRPDHVFHPPDVLGVCLRRDAPSLDDPGLNVGCLSALRTVSMLMESTKPSTTSSSASSCNVQWQRPSGGSLQASWISFCSTSPLILILSGRGGCGLWSRAAWNPSVTSRLRTRSTVRKPIPRAATMPSSVCPLPAVSASNRMRAWASLRAAALPADTNCSNSARSSAASVTRYFSIGGLLLLRRHTFTYPQQIESPSTRQSKIDGILVGSLTSKALCVSYKSTLEQKPRKIILSRSHRKKRLFRTPFLITL